MRLHVTHETRYHLNDPARRSIQILRLTPRLDRCQRTLDWQITGPDRLTAWVDGFGNRAHLADNGPHGRLLIRVEGVVETTDTVGILPLEDGLPPRMFLRPTPLTQVDDALRAFAAPFVAARKQDGSLAALHALMNAVADKVVHTRESTAVDHTAAQALAGGAGVCQDQAHVFIAAARLLEVPCRYVSGYLFGQESTAMASHAWAEAFLEDLGWVSFDPANRQSATEAYIRLAVGLDYQSACPIRGQRTGGGEESLEVTVTVQVQHPGQSQSQAQ
ncbi:MAG: transglutaminase family protein [Magnetococcales bacterium]|nr:transglutaminase family protein [Magnetococcales bacterium]